MKVKKAVILAAGFGTRMLPATKAVPKEMLTVVDRPSIQYIVEELAASGIEDILIVLGRGKSAVLEHFDRAPELEAALVNKSPPLYNELLRTANLANISYVRQQEMRGTGSAVMYAKSFAGDEPIVVIYPDDIMVADSGEPPVTAQICAAYEKHGLGAVAMKSFSDEDIMKYSSLDAKVLEDNLYKITDMIEKPQKHEVFTNYSVLGRCVLPAKIFGILEETKPGLNGEIWLTDAMKTLARAEGMVGVDFKGTRYDTGNKLGFLKAVTEIGLQNEEAGAEFKQYLKELMNT
ncbi:MAG: UTP--glucose-1-phosphate uridylyltransferase [Oscillospiraceae bacterium]|nr:UTP--glucose-1-phosphate uridylyltransferase [Oscillospiraceae bacterium]